MVENSSGNHNRDLLVRQEEINNILLELHTLREQLGGKEGILKILVEDYQKQRYQKQEEIWRARCLTRCTSCYNTPPGEPSNWQQKLPTPWGGWGLIPLDDAHYVLRRGKHWHTSHESDYHHSHLYFERLCNSCYTLALESHAKSGGGMHKLTTPEVEEINRTVADQSCQYGYMKTCALTDKFGHATDVEVRWYNLPIPEGAYEIGDRLEITCETTLSYQLKGHAHS